MLFVTPFERFYPTFPLNLVMFLLSDSHKFRYSNCKDFRVTLNLCSCVALNLIFIDIFQQALLSSLTNIQLFIDIYSFKFFNEYLFLDG